MGRSQDFPLPPMPGVCLKCGGRGQLTPAKFTFQYTSKASVLISLLALLVGVIYYHQQIYRLPLPICQHCSAHLKRSRTVAVLGWLLFFPLLVGSFVMGMDYPWMFALPLPYALAAYIYYEVLRRRATPKTLLVNNDNLIITIPNYGEFVLFERTTGRRPQPKRAPEPMMLNRAICADCGFINFSSAAECKKCQAPLGAQATA
jgi:ribosomal protein L40E